MRMVIALSTLSAAVPFIRLSADACCHPRHFESEAPATVAESVLEVRLRLDRALKLISIE